MEGIILIAISSYSAPAELWYLLITEVQDILVFTGDTPHSDYRVFQQYRHSADIVSNQYRVNRLLVCFNIWRNSS